MSRLLVVHKPQHSSKPSVTIYRPLGRFKTPGGTLKTPIKCADQLGCSDCRLVMRGRLLQESKTDFENLGYESGWKKSRLCKHCPPVSKAFNPSPPLMLLCALQSKIVLPAVDCLWMHIINLGCG